MCHNIQFVSLDQLVCPKHSYRRLKAILNESFVGESVRDLEKASGREGYGIARLFYVLLLQFMEDLSDRECERFLAENNAGKWFCGFDLMSETPDHNTISRARKRIGPKRLGELFSRMRERLNGEGIISEVFTFVDATHLISKANLWRERDRAIREKYEKLNNEILPKVAVDKQARIGCKGKDKFWYGYKAHVTVDTQSGLINKVAVTPANVSDAHGFKHVCPNSGAVYADKGYCLKSAINAAKSKGVHLAAIKRNNMKGKNHDLDKYHSHIRMPYERVFSKLGKRTPYGGIAKNRFRIFMKSICHNLKRWIVLDIPEFAF